MASWRSLLAGFLNLLVLYQIRARAEPAETGFLVRVYLWTILLRYSVAIVLNAFAGGSAFAAAFWGDSGSYDTGGHQLALMWSGEPITTAYMSRAVSGYGWVYFVGSIYYVVGRNQLLVQFINGLFGGLTVLLIYAIAARLFDRRRPGGLPSSWRSSRRSSSGPPVCTRTRRSSCASPWPCTRS